MKRTSVDEVLAATHESLLAVGVRRTTFAEVGRRAGLSRATLYTHFPDVEAAIAAVLTRELGDLLSAADMTARADEVASRSDDIGRSGSDAGRIDHGAGRAAVGAPAQGEVGRSGSDVGGIDHSHGDEAATGEVGHARDRLLAAIGRVLEELPDHPLFRKVVEVDADLLLPYVVARLGGVPRLALAQLHRRIEEGQAEGTIRHGDAHMLAMAVLLAVQAVLLASQAPEVSADRDTLHAALLDLIDRGLGP